MSDESLKFTALTKSKMLNDEKSVEFLLSKLNKLKIKFSDLACKLENFIEDKNQKPSLKFKLLEKKMIKKVKNVSTEDLPLLIEAHYEIVGILESAYKNMVEVDLVNRNNLFQTKKFCELYTTCLDHSINIFSSLSKNVDEITK